MDQKLLAILRCPVSKQKLSLLDSSTLQALQERIKLGEIVSVDKEVVVTLPQAALITENRNTIYLVLDSIPVMLEEKSIDNSHYAL